jgi:preprotein translocase subunit SecA
MDYLKEGIGLRGYGQRDPLVEYKKESYDMFQAMMDRIEDEAMRYLFLIQPMVEEEMPRRKEQPLYYQRAQGGPVGQKVRQARSLIPKKRKKR